MTQCLPSEMDSKCDEPTNDCLQGSLVISCDHNVKPVSIIEKILNTEEEAKAEHMMFGSQSSVKCYKWHIDNKYYSADIHFFETLSKDLISAQFAHCVHAVIVYVDNNRESSFTEVKSWLPFINEFDAEVKILVCGTATDNSVVNRLCLQRWCIEEQFELVELMPDITVEDEGIEDLKETTGVLRITQALQAHTWPYITYKDLPQYFPSEKYKNLIHRDIVNSFIDNNSSDNNDEQSKSDAIPNLIPFVEDNKNNDEISDEENEIEIESFEDLFIKFNNLKAKASRLNDSERRLYAEKVTLAFWKAIGGDNQEIEGLDDP